MPGQGAGGPRDPGRNSQLPRNVEKVPVSLLFAAYDGNDMEDVGRPIPLFRLLDEKIGPPGGHALLRKEEHDAHIVELPKYALEKPQLAFLAEGGDVGQRRRRFNLSGNRPCGIGCEPLDALHQFIEPAWIVFGPGEVDPEPVSQEWEGFALPENCGNEAKPALFLPLEHTCVFFLHPAGRHGFRRHDQHASPRAPDRLVERFRDQIARTFAPVVNPDCEPLALQISRESLNPRLVFALVADEDVIIRVHF